MQEDRSCKLTPEKQMRVNSAKRQEPERLVLNLDETLDCILDFDESSKIDKEKPQHQSWEELAFDRFLHRVE